MQKRAVDKVKVVLCGLDISEDVGLFFCSLCIRLNTRTTVVGRSLPARCREAGCRYRTRLDRILFGSSVSRKELDWQKESDWKTTHQLRFQMHHSTVLVLPLLLFDFL